MITYHTTEIDNLKIFHRQAGHPDLPALVLLHGFPSSSHMYRELLPLLAPHFFVLAPDYPGSGYSDAPAPETWAYTFEHLAEIMEKFIAAQGLKSYALYLQDFGGPVGFRLAAKNPEQITGLILQNANAYSEGISDFMAPLGKYWTDRAGMEPAIRSFLSPETTRFQYTHGASQPERISPDAYTFDQALLDRPGIDRIQLELLYNYQTNLPLYPVWQNYFRQHQPRTLITWGKNDPFFTPSGAQAYLRDLPQAELHWLDTGHFALEEEHQQIAAKIIQFFSRQ